MNKTMINQELLNFLCCPECKQDLVGKDDLLICGGCGRNYAIKNEVPVLVDLDNLPQHFQVQVSYFEKEDAGRTDNQLREWQKSYIRRLDENIQFKNGDILIDIGTGSGYIAVEMAKRGLKVIACDLTLKELIKLKEVIKKEHLENNLLLVCCSTEDLPLKTGVADYLVSNAVLEHLLKEEETITDIARVCKGKSRLMITVPLELKYILPILWLPMHVHDRRIGHLRRYNERILLNKFGKFGYKIKNIYYPGHFEKELVASLSALGFSKDEWNSWAETCDRKKEHKKYGAINICIIFER